MTATTIVSPKGLVGIESVIYGVEDVAQSTKFFGDFGLEQIEKSKSGATFATSEKTTIALRNHDDETLPQAQEPGSTVREIVWGVDTKEHLDALAADLSRDLPVLTDADGTLHTVDPNGYGIALRVTDKEPVALQPVTLNTIGDAVRLNARAHFYERARPAHIGHIVLYATDFDAMVDFYTERLGFWVSDVLNPIGLFLRCSSDHHNLFVIRHHRTGLNHLSFGLHDFDEIMGGFNMLSKQGWEPVWGLGRHYVGSNIFYYFRNPAGAFVEYYADMDCILDPTKWEPGTFDVTDLEKLHEWGGPIPDDFIN